MHTFLITGTKKDQLFSKVSWDKPQLPPYVPQALENNCPVKECSWPVDFFCRLWKIGATNLELKWIVAWYEMKWLGPSFAAPIKIMDQSCNVLWSSFVSCSSLCYTENRTDGSSAKFPTWICSFRLLWQYFFFNLAKVSHWVNFFEYFHGPIFFFFS